MKKIKDLLNRYSHWVLLAPFLACFTVFILLPVLCAVGLSFTRFDTVQFPEFIGLDNYISIFTQDRDFMQHVLPNTIVYALAVGPGGYLLSFMLAWLLSQLSKWPRTVLAIVIYSPSILGNVALAVVWGVLFSGDSNGYLNRMLLAWNVIEEPILWLTSPQYLMPIMIFVGLWSSMGVGFLAMLSGILNVNPELYEAAAIDGVHSRLQEIWYVTIPAIKPQMLFGAVMGGAALIVHLAGLESFGVPYLTPFAVSAGKEAREHVFLRRPLPQVKDRPPALHPLNRRKQR